MFGRVFRRKTEQDIHYLMMSVDALHERINEVTELHCSLQERFDRLMDFLGAIEVTTPTRTELVLRDEENPEIE